MKKITHKLGKFVLVLGVRGGYVGVASCVILLSSFVGMKYVFDWEQDIRLHDIQGEQCDWLQLR